MKIALVHSHLNDRGGSQRYVIEIAKNLKFLGLEVDVFAYEYNEKSCYPELTEGLNISYLYTREMSSNDAPLRSKNRLRLFLKQIYNIKFVKKVALMLGVDYLYSMKNNLRLAKKLAALINEKNSGEKYDIVFAHEGPLSIWSAINFKKKYGTPIFWFCYDTLDKWYIDWSIAENLSKKMRNAFLNLYWIYDRKNIRKNVDRCAVLDKSIQEKFYKFYQVTPDIIRGGINKAYISPKRSEMLRKKYRLHEDAFIVSCVTRFRRYRRVHDLFALGKKLEPYRNVYIYINSPINEQDYYDETIRKYAKYIYPKGNIIIDISYPSNDDELYAIYRSSNIFVFPNEFQTWGNAPLEAMASGTVAIVSDGCGISEVIKEITDTVYQTGNINQLAAIVLELLNNPRLLKIYADKQLSYVKNNLTWEKICEQYISAFQSLIRDAAD